MKTVYILAALFLISGPLQAMDAPVADSKDGSLKIVNDFQSDITVTVYKGNDEKIAPALRKVEGAFPLKVTRDTTLIYRNLKDPVFLWVDVTFRNGSTWTIDAFRLDRGSREVLTIRDDLFGRPITKDSEKYFKELKEDFYSDITILEQNVRNQDEQLKFLFGGLAIVKVDGDNGDNVRINYMESGILGRQMDLDTVFTERFVERYQYILKDSFLLEPYMGRKNLVPGIQEFAKVPRPKGHLYKISYAIKGLDNSVQFQDSKTLEQRWKSIKKDLRNIFLEDYIQAVQKKSNNESIQVREYNRVSGYKLMSVEIDEYGPYAENENDPVGLVTREGPYFLQQQRVFEDLQGESLLALGYQGATVDHTEWIREQAVTYLDELMQIKGARQSFYLDKLNKLGIQGYYQVNRSEYVSALQSLRDQLSVPSDPVEEEEE